jgi:hypothetical protein
VVVGVAVAVVALALVFAADIGLAFSKEAD